MKTKLIKFHIDFSIFVSIVVVLLFSFQTIFSQNTWKKANGIGNFAIQTIYQFENYCFASTLDSGIYRSVDGGRNWHTSYNGIIDTSTYKTVNNFSDYGNRIYAITGNIIDGHLYYSDDSGDLWDTTTFPSGGFDFVVVDSVIIVSIYNKNFIYNRSTDYGETWETYQYPGSEYLRVFKKNGNIIYSISNSKGLISSSDLGLTWHSIAFSGSHINDYVFFNGKILIIKQNGFYITDCDGSNLTEININGMDEDYWKIYKLHVTGDTIFAHTAKNIYYTVHNINGFCDWMKLENFPMSESMIINCILVVNDNLLIGTLDPTTIYTTDKDKGIGIWYLDNSTNVQDINNLNSNLLVYPNPANEYISLKTDYIVNFLDNKVEIYSIFGEKLILSEDIELIDISHLTNGSYIIKFNNTTHKFIKY